LTGVTGQSKDEAASLFHEVVFMHSSKGSFIGSGGALCGFQVLIWWLVLFA
jgi:hypothetical protein